MVAILLLVLLAVPQGDDAVDLLRRLDGPDRQGRRAAQVELHAWIAEPGRLAECLQATPGASPEVWLRLVDAVVEQPGVLAALLPLLLADAAEVADRARELLLAWVRAEVVRRVDPAVLIDGHEERVFADGVVTGWPLAVGDDIPLWLAVEWLQATVPPTHPIAFDPWLDLSAADHPIAPIDLLPGTAAGLLGRWLVPRGLAVIDLDAVWLIVAESTAATFRQQVSEYRQALLPTAAGDDHDADDVARARLAHEAAAARLLGERLADADRWRDRPDRMAPLALAVGGEAVARAAAARFPRNQDAAQRDLLAHLAAGCGEPAIDPRFLRSDAAPRMRVATLSRLARDASRAAALAGDLLVGDEPALLRAGCYLARRGRVAALAPRLRSLAQCDDPQLALLAAIAGWIVEPLGDESAATLLRGVARGVAAPLLPLALHAACLADAASGGRIELAELLSASEERSRAIGVGLLARRGEPLPSDLGPAQRDCALLIGSVYRSSASAPLEDALAGAIAADPARQQAWRAASAWSLVRSVGEESAGWQDLVDQVLAADAPVALRALLLVTTLDLLHGHDLRAGGMRRPLLRTRGAEPQRRGAAAELAELFTAEHRGEQALWLDPLWLPLP